MLLLLKTPITATAASLGIGFGLTAAGSGVTTTVGIQFGLTPPESIEFNITDLSSLRLGLSGIGQSFQARTAVPGITCGLTAIGGFGSSPTLPLTFGLSGTVGTVFQGHASLDITQGISGSLSALGSAVSTLQLTLNGTPIISGGVLSSAGILDTHLDVATTYTLGANAPVTLNFGLAATGQVSAATLVESMIVTFERDSIRTFFRKK